MPSCVIDISAVFVDLQNERGAAEARRWLRDAAISAVNLHEIVARATEKGAAPDQARQIVDKLRLAAHAHDADAAFEAGLLRVATKGEGLGLEARTCLASARQLGLPAVTADAAWADLAGALGVEVVTMRWGPGGAFQVGPNPCPRPRFTPKAAHTGTPAGACPDDSLMGWGTG